MRRNAFIHQSSPMLIPLGYMAKRILARPESMPVPIVIDICSLSNCLSEDFCDYTKFWNHNGYWLFDSPILIEEVANEARVSLKDCKLLYFEAYALEWDAETNGWQDFKPEDSFVTNVAIPKSKILLGFDVVTYTMGSMAECSPLSCNGLASEIPVNAHCLMDTFESAKEQLEQGIFDNSEPGPYRIIAVYETE